MIDHFSQLTVHLQAGPDADPEELDELSRGLRQELLELDVDAVEPARAGQAPPGARAVDAASVGALVVTLLHTPELLVGVAAIVQAWLGTNHRRSARLELDGDVIELSGLSSRDQRALIEAWVRRAATQPAPSGG